MSSISKKIIAYIGKRFKIKRKRITSILIKKDVDFFTHI